MREHATLLCLGLALYLPGLFSIPPVDRDESRFAQATRQMLETGDFVRIRFQDEPRNKKPAGIHWLQAACVAATTGPASREIWPYRLPSLAGALASAHLTLALGLRMLDRRAALLGAALLAASPALDYEAHQATTDAVLLFTAIAAQTALHAVYEAARRGGVAPRRWAAAFWAAQGAAILVKGPVVTLLGALTIVTLGIADRDWRLLRGLRLAWGPLLTAAIAAPWLVAVSLATDGAFARDAISNDLLPKLVSGQESHAFPPGFHLLLAPATLWPASILAIPAARWAWKSRGDAAVRFALAWVVPFWIVLEAVPTKLPHYVLPAFPALVLLASRWAYDGDGRWARRAWRCIAATAILLAPSLELALPRIDALWVSDSIAGAVDRHRDPAAPDEAVVSAGYAEPSLVFLLGTRTRLLLGREVAPYLRDHPRALAAVSARERDVFAESARQLSLSPRLLETVRGFQYSKGRNVEVDLYTTAGASPQ